MDLLWFILDYQLGEPTIRSARSPRAVSVWSAFLMPFLPFVYGYPSSCPRAHCTPNKSVPTLPLRYTRRHGPTYTGPCPKALTECSPLDFRRSSIHRATYGQTNNKAVQSRKTCIKRSAIQSSKHNLWSQRTSWGVLTRTRLQIQSFAVHMLFLINPPRPLPKPGTARNIQMMRETSTF